MATKRAAIRAVTEFSRQQIYSFALFTSIGFDYVLATVPTADGLEKVVNKYLAEPNLEPPWDDRATVMKIVKWSPCDSPLHMVLADEFVRSDEFLTALGDSIDPDDEGEWEQLFEGIYESFFNALLLIRQAGIFDDTVVINILAGDQGDEERIENPERLNSPATAERYRVELELGTSLFLLQYQPR